MSAGSQYTFSSTLPERVPVHDELRLRCDCGVEHLDIDLWFTTNAADFRVKDKQDRKRDSKSRWFDDGYLTVTQGYGWNQPWKLRLKAAWELLRGREYILSSVILKPEDHDQLRSFFGGKS